MHEHEIGVNFVPCLQNKTRLKLREDTFLKNYPLFCPKCKQERLISAENLKVFVVEEKPDLDPIR